MKKEKGLILRHMKELLLNQFPNCGKAFKVQGKAWSLEQVIRLIFSPGSMFISGMQQKWSRL